MSDETPAAAPETRDEYDFIVTEEAKKDPDWRAKAKTGWGNLHVSPDAASWPTSAQSS